MRSYFANMMNSGAHCERIADERSCDDCKKEIANNTDDDSPIFANLATQFF